MRPIDDPTKGKIVRLFTQGGKTVTEITGILGISHVTIRKVLSEAEIDLPDKKTRHPPSHYDDPAVIERISLSYVSGDSIASIAKGERMTTKTVRGILRKSGAKEVGIKKLPVDTTVKIDDAEFVKIWQASTSVSEVERRTGMSRQAINSKLHLFRRNGVPLKSMPRVRNRDWSKLAELAKKCLEENQQ